MEGGNFGVAILIATWHGFRFLKSAKLKSYEEEILFKKCFEGVGGDWGLDRGARSGAGG